MTPRTLPGAPFRRHFGLPFCPGGQHAIVFAPLGAPRASATEFFGPRGGSQESSRSALGAIWRPTCAQETPGGLQEVILEPSGVDFGPSGAPFSKLPASVAEPSGEHAQTQAQARAQAQSASAGPTAKDSRPKAARPQGLGGPAGCAEHLNNKQP